MFVTWTLDTSLIGPFLTPLDLKHFGVILLKKINFLSCSTKRGIGIEPSQKIANLLSKQISTLAIAREVYGYSTEPENCEFAEQANQHSSCHSKRCMGMILSYFGTVTCHLAINAMTCRQAFKSCRYYTLMLTNTCFQSNKQHYSMCGGEKKNWFCMANVVHHLKKFIVGN